MCRGLLDSHGTRGVHRYAVALKAFRALSQTRENQACIISGESGAGKTETAKHFITRLLALSRDSDGGAGREYK